MWGLAMKLKKGLKDAEVLLDQRGPEHAVDRVHTALHGFLLQVLNNEGDRTVGDETLMGMFKRFRSEYCAAAREDSKRILGGLSTVVDALNYMRNHASGAHPSSRMSRAEGRLAVHSAMTLLHFVNDVVEDISKEDFC